MAQAAQGDIAAPGGGLRRMECETIKRERSFHPLQPRMSEE
jgi:hypothetical protein